MLSEDIMDWAAGGINMSDVKYAGKECIEFVDGTLRMVETVLILLACSFLFYWNLSKCKLPNINYADKDRTGRRFLLVLLCMCWGMEIGFKCASKTLIYLMNPCHITTAMQIYLLTAKPSKTVTAVFRCHLNYLNGPFLAIVFYETDTRLLPLEATVYWIQHGMMFVVPYYLLRLGGVYNVENLKEMQWNALAYSLLVAYHFTVLQGVSLITYINMNHIMCPVESDPFRGQFFRTGVFFHEFILSIAICKLYIIASDYFLTKYSLTRIKTNLNNDIDLVPGDTKVE